MSKTILVTGATGKQGGAVINALLSQSIENFTILAVTRDASSTSAKELSAKSPDIKLVEGNLDDVPGLFEEAHGVAGEHIWGVYSVQVSMGKGVTFEGEVKQGRDLIDESVKTGVKHFVYSSVERGGDEKSWHNETPIPHFQSKCYIERHLRDVTASGNSGEDMGWTILRPVAFMDNLAPGFPTKVFLAAMRNWVGQKPVQWVATSDIGVFAAKAFTAPHYWNRKAVGLAGDELTFDQLSESFEKATGKPAPVAPWFFGSALTYMVTELRLMIGWFASDGYRADIKARRKDHPGMLTLEQWLDKEGPFVTLGR
ncbi:Uu.00g079280.m01.CDS01 [Anthostomella pinea]|uniref:Uu.00g079280.m01.CDS01 n=1 Tax=Anthostomella pinea TaxID=933095 RepID=A0AAI8VLE6_9PEZI|nr:Uu.00g079280.m01.CDS01 [Anthostomella pinea]